MRNIAEFQIIGRVGNIKEVGSTTRVTIASNYPYRDDRGSWHDHVNWNEITLFSEKLQNHAEKHIVKGDLVFARGRIAQANYEKDGDRVFTVNLTCTEFSRLAKVNDKPDDTQQESDDSTYQDAHS
jgi:single-stranded DNA-binding protein